METVEVAAGSWATKHRRPRPRSAKRFSVYSSAKNTGSLELDAPWGGHAPGRTRLEAGLTIRFVHSLGRGHLPKHHLAAATLQPGLKTPHPQCCDPFSQVYRLSPEAHNSIMSHRDLGVPSRSCNIPVMIRKSGHPTRKCFLSVQRLPYPSQKASQPSRKLALTEIRYSPNRASKYSYSTI